MTTTDTALMPRAEKWYAAGHGAPTPWGAADVRYDYAPGIAAYSTPGHGGFKVNADLNAVIPPYMRHDDGWYEEDCDWAIVAVVFPSAFTESERTHAEKSFRNWYPDEWEQFTGRLLAPGESSAKDERRRRADAEAADLYMPVCAFGDWHDDVPEGQVGVIAALGGCREHGARRIGVLIPKPEYNDPMSMTFPADEYPTWEKGRRYI